MKTSSKFNLGSTAIKLSSFLAVALAVISVTDSKLDALRASNEVARQGFVSTADRARQLDCLTRNIYWESATEPFEGKVAVAQVTINRVESGRFASDICGVVYQKNVVYDKVICQFSWFCDGSSKIRPHLSSTLERVGRSGQKSPVRRLQTAQCEKRLVLSCGLCETTVGQTTGS